MAINAYLLLFAFASVPTSLQPPADQKLLLQAHGAGDQVYVCEGSDTGYQWTLKAPDAQLLASDGQVIGRHFAGPTWEAKDGSRVVGKAAANVPSPDAKSVPWLLLNATGHEGAGTFSGVLSVQRLNTQGGKAPAEGCDKEHVGTETRVPYQADYLFYGKSTN
jgi:Protein of unknown function (DUF3455)